MGDRTTVTVTVRERDVASLFDQNEGFTNREEFLEYIGSEDTDSCEGVLTVTDYQGNYGGWDKLTDVLDAHNIEHDHRWESGGDYGGGEKNKRLIEGVLETSEMYDDQMGEAGLAAQLYLLLEDDNVEEVKKIVRDKYKEYNPFEINPIVDKKNSVEFIKEDEKSN